MLAYVQISLDSPRENHLYEEMRQLPHVREVHVLYGEWDMIAKLEVQSPEELAAFVMENIRTLPGVKLTSTMIVAK